jgi:hypothetical protein
MDSSDTWNRLTLGSFTVRLSETAPTWSRAVAPIAEWISGTLWAKRSRPYRQSVPGTRLTESHRRQARSEPVSPTAVREPKLPNVCRICGASINHGDSYCASCSVNVSRESLIKAAQDGRMASHSREAETRRSETQRRHHAAKRAWRSSDLPNWLNEITYREKIQPRLAELSVPTISKALGISGLYATDIRAGSRRPHQRHWETLAGLIGFSMRD